MKKLILSATMIVITLLVGCNNTNLSAVSTPAPTPYVDKVAQAKHKNDLALSDQYFAEAQALYNQYKYDEAIDLCNKALALNTFNHAAYTIKGIALCFKGNYKDGMILLKKATVLSREYVPAIYNMALGYKLQHDYDNSLIWFNKALALDPKNVWSYYGISTIYADRNNTEQSLIYLEKAINLDPAVKSVAKNQSHFDRLRNNAQFIKLVS